MNKAFVREPEDDGRAFCPRCRSLGVPVEAPTLDAHIRPEARDKIGGAGWFCNYPQCEVAYFNLYDAAVTTAHLQSPVYPKDAQAPICACFGLTFDDVLADLDEGTPTRIRALLAKSKTPDARCTTLAAAGRPCIPAVQELYMRLRAQG